MRYGGWRLWISPHFSGPPNTPYDLGIINLPIRSDRTTTTIHGVGIGALRRMEALGFHLIFQVRLTHPTILVLLTYL